MNRLGWSLLAFSLLVPLATRAAQSTGQPVVLISVDTWRGDRTGAAGYHRKVTPHLDALAEDFVVFTDAMSQAPLTAPSHISMLTGMSPFTHGIVNYEALKGSYRVLNPGIPTLAETLRAAGYATAAFTGGGNAGGKNGIQRGFDSYDETLLNGLRNLTTLSMDPPLEWVDRTTERHGKRFFLFLHTYLVHDPYILTSKWSHAFRESFSGDIPYDYETVMRQVGVQGDFTLLRKAFWGKFDKKNPEHLREIIDLYDAEVLAADSLIDEFIRGLKSRGLYEPSLIIVTSDHGEEFLEHGNTLHGLLWREHLHVPLYVKFPGEKFGGTRITSRVRLIDLQPTILESIGIQSGTVPDGRSLLPVIRGEERADRLLLAKNDGTHVLLADGGLTLYRQGTTELLFDDARDPDEKHNVAPTHPKRLTGAVAELERVLAERAARGRVLASASSSREIDEQTRERLRALGYLE